MTKSIKIIFSAFLRNIVLATKWWLEVWFDLYLFFCYLNHNEFPMSASGIFT